MKRSIIKLRSPLLALGSIGLLAAGLLGIQQGAQGQGTGIVSAGRSQHWGTGGFTFRLRSKNSTYVRGLESRLTCIRQLALLMACAATLLSPLARSTTVNPGEYFINSSQYRTLHYDRTDANSYGFVSFYENSSSNDKRQRYWYTKLTAAGTQFERYAIYDGVITLERDTSWSGGGNDAYDVYPYGSLKWLKLSQQSDGETLSSAVVIAGYNHAPSGGSTQCAYNDATPRTYAANYTKSMRYMGVMSWGGDVGSRETIRLEHDNEAFYYAKGMGWVAWKAPDQIDDRNGWIIWNRGRDDSGMAFPQILPKDNCGLNSNWQASFRDTSTIRDAGSDWDFLRGKATCAGNEGIVAISRMPIDLYASRALCRRGVIHTGVRTDILTVDQGSDQRRYARGGDWSFGNYKLECGRNEYVAGVSQNTVQYQGNNRFHGVLCARASTNLENSCSMLTFANGDSRDGVVVTNIIDNRTHRNPVTGDWDFGAVKLECGLNQSLVGVSVNPSTGQPQNLLCCGS